MKRFYLLLQRLMPPRPLPSSPRANERGPCGIWVPVLAPAPALGLACLDAPGEERVGLTGLRARDPNPYEEVETGGVEGGLERSRGEPVRGDAGGNCRELVGVVKADRASCCSCCCCCCCCCRTRKVETVAGEAGDGGVGPKRDEERATICCCCRAGTGAGGSDRGLAPFVLGADGLVDIR